VNSHEDATYRLKLAKGYLSRAETDAMDGQWDGCLANAQEAVENAGKCVLANFRPVPKAHDVDESIERLLKHSDVPPTVKSKIEARLESFKGMGMDTHVRATYGDEEHYTPPWELIDESESKVGLEKARRAVALAEEIFAEMTGLSTSKSGVPDATDE